MPSWTFTTGVSGPVTPISQTVTVTGGGYVGVDGETIATGLSDQLFNFALDVSTLKGLYMFSDATVTMETNSSSAADQTITLTANTPQIWYANCGYSNPLTTDITKLYFTNASGATATITVIALYDVTP